MVYILNHKQQKQLEIIMKSSAQVAAAMPKGNERDAILRGTYRNSYLPLMKASKKCGREWYTKINYVLRYYSKSKKEQVDYCPLALFDTRHVAIFCTADCIRFTNPNPTCERFWYDIERKVVTYDYNATEKSVSHNAKLLMEMVGKLGTNESYTSLNPATTYNVLEGAYNVFFGILSEKSFIHLADVQDGYSSKFYWRDGDSSISKEGLR